MEKTTNLNRKIRILSLFIFINVTFLFSQEKSLEIIQNFSKKNYQKASNHKINYKGDAPFVMLSAYSTDLSLDEIISYRIKNKNQWSTWTNLKKPNDGEDVDRVVFDAIFIDTGFSEIAFKSNKTFNANVVFRLYIPEFTEAINIKPSIKKEIDNANKSVAKGGCVQPSFRGRTDWCPDGTCTKLEGTSIIPTHIVIHHSAGNTVSNDYAAVVRGYWDFHVNTRGWDDIGYNWLIDPNGILYEGRGDKIRGAHSSCMNGTSTGICVIGEYSANQPNNTMLAALEQMIAWDASDKDIDILASSYNTSLGNTIANVSGHKTGKAENSDSNCTATACPGDNMFNRLGSIRTNAANNTCNSKPYCEAKGNNSFYEWIKGVKIGSDHKTSGNDDGYSDKTNQVFTVEKGVNTAILLQPGYNATQYNENWKIWIDLNNDGDFDDAGEELFDNPGQAKNDVSGSINIPNSAIEGTTRMRVGMNGYSADYTLNPCGTFTYGEVEDYTINILQNSRNNPVELCDTKGNNSFYEWIANVTVNNQSNNSANDGGYKDYSNVVFNLQANRSYPISLSPGYESTPYFENWKIWIDFNQDGDLEDAGEVVYNNITVDKGTVTGTISIPSGLANGNYRMRVAMNGSSADYTLNPCDTFAYGEVEDYMININESNSGAAKSGGLVSAIIAYPNPVNDILNIQLNSSIKTITVYTINGSIVYQKKIQSESLDTIQTNSWQRGVYLIMLEGKNKREVIKVIKI